MILLLLNFSLRFFDSAFPLALEDLFLLRSRKFAHPLILLLFLGSKFLSSSVLFRIPLVFLLDQFIHVFSDSLQFDLGVRTEIDFGQRIDKREEGFDKLECVCCVGGKRCVKGDDDVFFLFGWGEWEKGTLAWLVGDGERAEVWKSL